MSRLRGKMLNRNSLAVFSFLFPLLGGAPLLAGNVYVMPSIGTTLAGYGSEALNPIGSIVLPSRPVQVIPATDGTKAFVRGNAPIAAISVADANLTVVKKQFDLATAPEAAVLTPDGKRLLVLAGDLAIFDADTETQVDTGEPISVGADPNDLVVSHDSRYAYVLSTTSRQVTRVDQLTFALTGSALALPGTPYHVSIAPNGNIWVSATNEVLEIDPLFMRLTGKQIKLSEPNSVPGKLDFTSDGRKAVLVTSLPGNRSSLLYLDLDKSTVIGGVRNLAEGLDEIVFLENQQKVLARTETSKLYTVKLTDFSYSEATFGGQKLSNVLALAGSLEPTPAAAFAVTGASATPPLRIYRINTATFVIAADAPAPDSPGEVAYGGPVLGPPGGAISIYSGNGQLVPSAWASAKPLVVQVLDRNGNPSRDIEVKWEIKAPATGVLVPVTGSDGNRTDENGLARMNYRGGAIFDSSTTSKKDIVTATALESSVDFVVTTYRTLYADGTPAAGPIRKVLEPPAGERLFFGGAGTVIEGAFEIHVLSGAKPDTGKPMSDVGVEIINASDPDRPPAAQCVGGYALTGNNGIAVCDLKVGGDLGKNPISVQVGGGVSFTDYYIEITPGPPAIVQKLEGDNQIGDPGQTLPIDLKAKITDLFGNPSEGVDVTWEVDPKGAATLIGETRKTDAEGGVSAKVRLGNVAGTHQIIVRSGDAVAAFRVTVNIALGSLQKVSGDLQSALIGQPFSQPLRVKAIDDQGQPLGNIVVAFNRTAGEGDLSAASATTDQNGEASITVVAGGCRFPGVWSLRPPPSASRSHSTSRFCRPARKSPWTALWMLRASARESVPEPSSASSVRVWRRESWVAWCPTSSSGRCPIPWGRSRWPSTGFSPRFTRSATAAPRNRSRSRSPSKWRRERLR